MSRSDLKNLVVKTYRDHGDALAGEQIVAQAREVGRVHVVTGTSTHKIQETVLKRNVLCVIDRPFKLVGGPMRLKERPFEP